VSGGVATRSPPTAGGVGAMEGRAGREVGRVEDDSGCCVR
jgi:hypothetical protein